MDLNSIFGEALSASSSIFLSLISEVSRILSQEATGVGKLDIMGRLVRIPPAGEAIIVGDIHGDLQSLKHILYRSGFFEKAPGGGTYLIFLGDYGDRGVYSPEVYYVILTLKKLFPENVILLQGNHEGPEDLLAYPHDLPHHLRRRFGPEGSVVYRDLSNLFRRFYTAVLIKGRYVMLHGGVPSMARSIEDLAFAYMKHPLESHLEEILWSDPVDDINGTYPSPRGAGLLFGEDVTRRFLKLLGVKFLIRGHEPAGDGYKFNHGGAVLTLFSRKGPPYHNSHAAYLTLNLSLHIESAEEIEKFIQRF